MGCGTCTTDCQPWSTIDHGPNRSQGTQRPGDSPTHPPTSYDIARPNPSQTGRHQAGSGLYTGPLSLKSSSSSGLGEASMILRALCTKLASHVTAVALFRSVLE